MNPQKLKQLLHNFFSNSYLSFDVLDKKETQHTPIEWFIAPLDIIKQVIQFIMLLK